MDFATATADAVRQTLVDTINYIPNVLAAIVIVLVGIIVAWAVKTIIVRTLGYLKLKKYTDALGLGKVFNEEVEVVELIGDIAKWVLLLPFIVVSLDVLKLSGVNDLLKDVLAYVPNVAKAVVLIMIAAIIGDLASRVIRASAKTVGVRTSEMLSDIARWSILIFAFFGALVHLGIATELINTLWTGIVALLVVAGGLSFGLAGQDQAKEIIERARKNFPGRK